VKPTVRRARTHDGHLAPGWITSRPAYGFTNGSVVHVTRHRTFRAAHDALKPRTASAYQETQKAHDDSPHRIEAHGYQPRRVRP
jgi:hypothetical protein